MKQIDLSAGTIEYSDTGGDGPVVVLLHGLMMDASLWDQTAAAGKLPPAMFGLFMQQMRLRPMRRSPAGYGWLTKRGDPATVRCLEPVLTRPGIRQDTVRVLRAAAHRTRKLT